MTKVLFFYNEEWEKEYFESQVNGDLSNGQTGFDIDYKKGNAQDYSDISDDEVEIISVFVGSKIGAEMMDRFPNLKYIATRSTGFDHIDLEEAKKRGIQVSNVPAYGSQTVAEFAFALLLAVSRKIFPAYDQILEKGSFNKEGLRGFDLEGKTLGVLGTGKIGKHVIKIAKGFGMRVVAFDRHPDQDYAQKMNFEYADFDEVLVQADVLTLHLPYNPETHHILNEEAFEKMKKGVVIINTSRGGVIDTEALVEALKDGIVQGAGLDVLEAEIYMGNELDLLKDENSRDEDVNTVLNNQYLIENPNVIITPHNAFNTKEAIERIFDVTFENLVSFKNGEPINLVK